MPIIAKQENKLQDKLYKKRHSLAHILAEAVQKVHPDAKLGIGPAIENGFYYDFDMDEAISTKDLKKIQKEMKKIISKKPEFIYKSISIDEAKILFNSKGEKYKSELIEDLSSKGESSVSWYYTGDNGWVDLCKGPHIEPGDKINMEGLKLDRVSGAYWKGDENNKMLQRIYGLYFDEKEELDSYIKRREEAKKFDHRKIGKEMGRLCIELHFMVATKKQKAKAVSSSITLKCGKNRKW